MDYHLPGGRFATGTGNLVVHGYSAGQSNDSDMDNVFDFEGYHGGHQQNSDYLHQETVGSDQEYHDAQQGYSPTIVDSDEMNDSYDEADDGWQSLFEAAFTSYYSDNPLKCSLLPSTPLTSAGDLDDPPGSADGSNSIALPSTEKWDVDKATMEYLASVLALSAPVSSLSTCCGLRSPLRDVKIEEPVLRSDPATDMQRLRERNVVRLNTKGIKPVPSDKRHDQDLQWSSKSLKLPNEMDKQLATEKMNVNSETGRFLKEIFEDMKDDFTFSLSKDRISKVHFSACTSLARNLTDMNRLQCVP